MKDAAAYHHGDLRNALLAEAKTFLVANPAELLTLKGLATSVGVSHAAAYRHFASRDALLAVVAEQGFATFMAEIDLAVEAGPVTESVERVCRAYLRCALRNIGIYKLMFTWRNLTSLRENETLSRSAIEAFEHFKASLRHCTTPEELSALTAFVWSTLHGAVLLQAEDFLAGPAPLAVSADEVVTFVVRTVAAIGPDRAAIADQDVALGVNR